MKVKYLFLAVLVLIAILVVFWVGFKQPQTIKITPTPNPTVSVTPSATSSAVLGVRTKTASCVSENGLPDKDCTPGALIAGVGKEQICTPGYAKGERNVSETAKKAVFAEYGIVSHQAGEYEVDHLISLELGGSNEIANLWPQSAAPEPGFHQKDQVENLLHKQVCEGKISLEEAQKQIALNWLELYFKLEQ